MHNNINNFIATVLVQVIRLIAIGMKKSTSKSNLLISASKCSESALSCVVHEISLVSNLIFRINMLFKMSDHFMLVS